MEVTAAAMQSWNNTTSAAPSVSPNMEEDKLKEVCQQFEAIFIKQMLDSMRETVSKSDLLNGGMAEDIYEDMLYTEYADTMSKTESFGISEMLYSQLSPQALAGISDDEPVI